MNWVRILNQTNEQTAPVVAEYCQSFFCQLRGLMFTKSLPENHGLLLVQGADSKLSSSIHMMFMWIDLAVVWINSDLAVVDKVLAQRWKPAYFPKQPAKYVLEFGVSHLNDFAVGDKVRFEKITRE